MTEVAQILTVEGRKAVVGYDHPTLKLEGCQRFLACERGFLDNDDGASFSDADLLTHMAEGGLTIDQIFRS